MGNSVSVLRAVQIIDRPVFTTREIAALSGRSISTTSQSLGRLHREQVILRTARGVWCIPTDPRFTPHMVASFLAGGHQAYVSFYSALHLHRMIGQIPQVIYAATTAHSRAVDTPVGSYSFHRIEPRFFAGFDWYGHRRSFLVASREKALVDCLYLSTRKGRRFGLLPEIELGSAYSRKTAFKWVDRIPDHRIRQSVREKLTALHQRTL